MGDRTLYERVWELEDSLKSLNAALVDYERRLIALENIPPVKVEKVLSYYGKKRGRKPKGVTSG